MTKKAQAVDQLVGAHIVQFRRTAGLNSAELASHLGLSPAALRSIEAGQMRAGTLLLSDLADFFETSVVAFFDDADNQADDFRTPQVPHRLH